MNDFDHMLKTHRHELQDQADRDREMERQMVLLMENSDAAVSGNFSITDASHGLKRVNMRNGYEVCHFTVKDGKVVITVSYNGKLVGSFPEVEGLNTIARMISEARLAQLAA